MVAGIMLLGSIAKQNHSSKRVAGRLTQYKLLGLIPDNRVNYLDDIFEQCKQVLDDQNWNRAVEYGAGLAQEVLNEHAETLLPAYV